MNVQNESGDLLQQLQTDLAVRWEHHERTLVESYFSTHPHLLADEQSLLDLIYTEYCIREGADDHPSPQEYFERFPQLRNQLSQLFEIHKAIDSYADSISVSADESKPSIPPELADTQPPRQGAASLGVSDVRPASGPGSLYEGWPQSLRDHLERGTPFQLGEYRLMELIGRGGMGLVFKAHHERMDRDVAIKLISPSLLRDADAVSRFQREVRAMARVSHPHIVLAHDAGEQQGLHFLVMEFVAGQDLDRCVRENGPLPWRTAVQYVLEAARGLQCAHDAGIVHRDIKPANLLLDSKRQIKVLDLGLARLSESNPEGVNSHLLTSTGNIMGTIDFMSPEQALDIRHVDQRGDVYSLGCTLFYLLTATRPYEGDTLMKRILAHRDAPIPHLAPLVPGLPAAVDQAFQRMVAKRPEDRYPTMAAAAEAQTALLLLPDRMGTNTTRHRPKRRIWIAAGLAGCLCAFLGVIAIFRDKDGHSVARVEVPPGGSMEIVSGESTRTDRRDPGLNSEAQPAEHDADNLQRSAAPTQPLNLMTAGGWLDLLPLFRPTTDTIHGSWSDLNRWVLDADGLHFGPEDKTGKIRWPVEIDSTDLEIELDATFHSTDGPPGFSIEFPSSDGTVVLLNNGPDSSWPRFLHVSVAIPQDEPVALRFGFKLLDKMIRATVDLDDQRIFRSNEPIEKGLFRFDESELSAWTGGMAVLANTSVVIHAARIKANSGELQTIRPLPPGTTLPKCVSQARLPGLVPVPPPTKSDARWQLQSADAQCTTFTWSADGRQQFFADTQGCIRILDAKSEALDHILVLPEGVAYRLASQPHGRKVAAATGTKAWLIDTDPPDTPIACRHGSGVHYLCWSPDGSRLATSCHWPKPRVRMWSATGDSLWEAEPGSIIDSIAWSADGNTLFGGGPEVGVLSWSASIGEKQRFALPKSRAIAINPAGDRLVAGRGPQHGSDDYLRFYRLPGGDTLQAFPPSGWTVFANSLAFHANGTALAMASQDAHIRILDVATNQMMHDYPSGMPAGQTTWRPGGDQLAFEVEKRGWFTWTPLDGSWPKQIGRTRWINRLCSSNGKNLLLISEHDWRLVDLSTGRSTAEAYENGFNWNPTSCAEVGDDNFAVWTRGCDGFLINAESGKREARFLAHTAGVNCASWNAAKQRIATSSYDRTIRIWRLGGSNERTIELEHAPHVLAWNPTGSLLAAGQDLGETNAPEARHLICFWDPNTGEKIQEFFSGETPVQSLLWPSDDTLVTLSTDKILRVWSVKDNTIACTRTEPAERIIANLLAPAHPWVLRQGPNWQLKQFDADVKVTLQDCPRRVAFEPAQVSPDGSEISFWCGEDSLWTWNLKTGELLRAFILLPRGQSLTLDPGGNIISQTSKAQREIVYTLEQPDGSLKVLSPTDWPKQ